MAKRCKNLGNSWIYGHLYLDLFIWAGSISNVRERCEN
jgi:hypothetical protein